MVCALTALCVAIGDFTAVGDNCDGWIILPPKRKFTEWAWKAVSQTVEHDGEGGELRVLSPMDADTAEDSSRKVGQTSCS